MQSQRVQVKANGEQRKVKSESNIDTAAPNPKKKQTKNKTKYNDFFGSGI